MSRSRYPWFQRAVVGCSLLYALVFVAMLVFRPGSRHFYQAFNNIYQILPPLFAATCGLAFVRRGRHISNTHRLGWLLIALGSLSFTIGQCTWTFYETFRGIECPSPGWADLGYLGAYPFLILGVILLFGATHMAGRARLVMDSAIASSSVGFISWYFLVRLLWQKSDVTFLGKLISISYPLGDVAVLFTAVAVLSAAAGNRDRRRSLVCLASGMVLIAFFDTTYTYYSLHNAYHTGMWTDWSLSFGYILIAYASLLRLWWASEPAPGKAAGPDVAPVVHPHPLRVLVPYLAVVSAFLLVLVHDYVTPPFGLVNSSTCIGGGLLLLLVILRQVFTVLENQHLAARLSAFNENLEQIVRMRTQQLSALQQLTKAVNSTHQAKEVVSAAVLHARQALGADAVALWLQEENPLEGVPGGPAADPLPELRMVQGLEEEPAVREFIARQAPLTGPRLLCLPPQIHSSRDSAGVLLLAPIRCQQRLLGLIGVIRWQGGFDGSETEMLESVGLEVGTALEMAHQYDAAVEAADLDPVTALYNHRFIHQYLDREFKQTAAREESLAVIMMDVNNFKLFNDTYGHPVGDEVLKRVAHVLREECRKRDLPGRYGGDEFLIVLPDSNASDALALAERLRERMAQEGFQRSSDERTVPVTLSFGIATFPADCTNRHELLTVADTNLYAAKGSDEGISGTTELQRTNRRLRNESSFAVLDAMVTAVDNKDRYTRRHSEDVTEYALWIAEEMRLSEETMRVIRMGGLLHDVGKIGVPDEVLRKPGRLTADEWEVMRRHPYLGALIVGGVPDMEPILDAVRHHHERWDGQGYPQGLEGAEIPLLGRILAVADAFSAMTTDRPYRKGMAWDVALEEIRANTGTQFDPALAQAFLRAAKKRRPAHLLPSDPPAKEAVLAA